MLSSGKRGLPSGDQKAQYPSSDSHPDRSQASAGAEGASTPQVSPAVPWITGTHGGTHGLPGPHSASLREPCSAKTQTQFGCMLGMSPKLLYYLWVPAVCLTDS